MTTAVTARRMLVAWIVLLSVALAVVIHPGSSRSSTPTKAHFVIAAEAASAPGEIVVDTNPVIDALQDPGLSAKVDSALAGRSPVLSPQALSEITSSSPEEVMSWLTARGGRLGADATEAGMQARQKPSSIAGGRA